MHAHRARAGVTLIELMVALVLLSMVLAIGALIAQRVLHVEYRTSALSVRRQSLSDALVTLARHVAEIDPRAGDLRVASDTALELLRPVGVTSVCRIVADTLTVGSGSDTLAWSTRLPRSVAVGDQVRAWTDATGRWQTRTVIDVLPASDACGDSVFPWPDRAVQRVVIDDSMPTIHPGAVLKVLQHERWSLLRGGSGEWSLALSAWDPARAQLGIPQPVHSPLASPIAPGGAGFSVRAVDTVGAVLTAGQLTRARSLLVVLRTPAHVRFGVTSDSVRINVGHH